MSAGWELAFVAVSALLGEPLDATLAALGDRGDGEASDLARVLLSPLRGSRAQAMARALSEVALAVDAARLA